MNGGGRKRILVVGGGFVGMYTALGLKKVAAEGHRVTVVTPENFMQYQPFLPEVASGTIDPRAVVVPLRHVLKHAEIVIGEVVGVDHPNRRVTARLAAGDERALEYDVLVLGAGSRSRVLPIPGLAEVGIGFKTVQEAIFLRNRVLSRLDVAAEADDPKLRDAALTFVVVGGGYAGIEAVGELEDLARDAARAYPELRGIRMRWVLVEAAGAILPELTPDLADYARQRLEERRIELLLNTQLESAEKGVIRLSDGQAFAADTLVWTAGVRPVSGPAKGAGLPLDEAGRVKVDVYLRVEGVEDVWAAGDAAAVPDLTTGAICPPTAQHAMRQARRLAANVEATLDGRPPERFVYRSIGSVCSLGRYKGIANVFGLKVKGFTAWFLHRSYHLWAMPTIGRRVRIALDWTVALLFPRDIAQLGSLEHPRGAFGRAAEDRSG